VGCLGAIIALVKHFQGGVVVEVGFGWCEVWWRVVVDGMRALVVLVVVGGLVGGRGGMGVRCVCGVGGDGGWEDGGVGRGRWLIPDQTHLDSSTCHALPDQFNLVSTQTHTHTHTHTHTRTHTHTNPNTHALIRALTSTLAVSRGQVHGLSTRSHRAQAKLHRHSVQGATG
jgi:hypothetical protein